MGQKRILLQTTIPDIEDDWNIGRFTLLKDHLESISGEDGRPLYDVTARNREVDDRGSDPILRSIDTSDFDQMWLFAVDTGDGLMPEECSAITRFRQMGRGLLSSRDHMDLGSSLCTIGGVGLAHHFHTRNPDEDESLRVRDDHETLSIDYPNFHSGSNGDYQRIRAAEPTHELLRRADGTVIEYFPAHPHEGSVSPPPGTPSNRVIATGRSQTTGREFNLIVAFERASDSHGNNLGRAIAESSFHHFVDYNWNIDAGCPSGLTEKPGNEIKLQPDRLDDVKQYVTNLASWLAG
jgi:hypothetical protein